VQAPLITLFGEQVTKQFLSESVNVLDDIIFALAPLGILTGVVSAIRIRGNSSLRAFIGRAQEGPGDAEQELLSCVSETTAELFNNGGIARIFGKPKILEVIVRRDSRDRSKIEIQPVSEALKETLKQLGKQALEPEEEDSFNVPNLSLNKGIKRRGDYWFVAACFTGCILQTGNCYHVTLYKSYC
jgi:ankyrin repeat domain-containing protein 50